MPNIAAASWPSGRGSPASSPACSASRRSFSIRAAAKPLRYSRLDNTFGSSPGTGGSLVSEKQLPVDTDTMLRSTSGAMPKRPARAKASDVAIMPQAASMLLQILAT